MHLNTFFKGAKLDGNYCIIKGLYLYFMYPRLINLFVFLVGEHKGSKSFDETNVPLKTSFERLKKGSTSSGSNLSSNGKIFFY